MDIWVEELFGLVNYLVGAIELQSKKEWQREKSDLAKESTFKLYLVTYMNSISEISLLQSS